MTKILENLQLEVFSLVTIRHRTVEIFQTFVSSYLYIEKIVKNWTHDTKLDTKS